MDKRQQGYSHEGLYLQLSEVRQVVNCMNIPVLTFSFGLVCE
jgi:hypothetical protein